jgi:hypothetical protein
MLGPGKLISCVVTNNYAWETVDGYSGGGVCMTDSGAVVRDCLIANNHAQYGLTDTREDTRHGGGVAMTAGLVENCIIRDNVAYGNYGGIYQMGGTVRNCLVDGNWSPKKDNQGVGVTAASASFVNNTVVTNGFGSAATSPVAATVAGGSVSNCLFAVNNGGDIAQTGGIVVYSRYAEAEGGTNISRAPVFRNPAKGDWRLDPTSPCVDAGDWTALGESREAVRAMSDLSGASRLFGGQVDMGCYESRVAGTMILLR